MTFDPATRTFHLSFASGGSGDVKLAELDEDHIALDVSFDRGFDEQPFAALRLQFLEFLVIQIGVDEIRLGVVDHVELKIQIQGVFQKPLHVADAAVIAVPTTRHGTSPAAMSASI